jgi:nucleotide-binding universal stress UspA family protein
MPYKKIVCGVTGSESSQKAAKAAARLAREQGADLIYVYAIDTSFLKGLTIELPSDFADKSLEQLGGHILERAVAYGQVLGVRPERILRSGPVHEVLEQVLTETKADLLIIGHEERSFFEKHLFKGDVEDHIRELTRRTGVEVQVIQ